jgi:SAM-dependent methyltransferase
MTKKDNWYSDEWFWETYGPIMFDELRMKRTPYEAERIVKLCSLSAGSSVLDCCCGMGRHSLELAGLGCDVTGVDLSEGYLKIAGEEAARRGLAPAFIHRDVRDIDYHDQFDAVINMFTSFGYFEDPDDDLRLLKILNRSLKPGGILFMEMSGKEILARDFEERVWFEREGIKIMLEYGVDLNWTELVNRWLFFQDERMTEYCFSHRIFSASEMARMLWEAGFPEIEIYGSFDRAPYDHKAEHLILMARKEG